MKHNETVAIVGTHPDTRADAPYDNTAVDIWVFNEAFHGSWVKRCDAVFQMHVPDIYRSPLNRNDPDHYKHLQETSATVYMQDVDPTIPTSEKYPLQEICAAFLNDEQYFTSSIDYAFALALYHDYQRILVYGVEMASHTEYHYQRNGVRLWLALAYAQGVQVEIHCNLSVFDQPCYGYDGIITTDPEYIDTQVRDLRAAADNALANVQKAERQLRTAYYTTPASVVQKISNLLSLRQYQGEIDGQLSEFERYQHKVKQMQAAGDLIIIDRNELEMAAAKHIPKVEENDNMVHRSAGGLDYVLTAWLKLNDPRALEQVKKYVSEHIKFGYQSGYEAGQYKTNHLLAGEIDKAIAAAGGQRALQLVTGEI